jgi:hypothetical protein
MADPPQSPLQVSDPRMAGLQIDCVRRLRKSRIGERARGNRRQIGQAFRLPEHGRTAVGTEVEGHTKSAVGLARIELGAAIRDKRIDFLRGESNASDVLALL